MALLRVLLGFASAPDHELEETAGHVLTSLYGNPVYPTPPVTAADLQAALTAFTDAIAAKNQAAQTLIGLLRQLASTCRRPSRATRPTGWRSCFPAGSTPRARARRSRRSTRRPSWASTTPAPAN